MAGKNQKTFPLETTANIEIRDLTDEEIGRLEHTLGKPVDQKFLVHWVSTAIHDVVRMPIMPTARECREGYLHVIRDGQRWIKSIGNCPGLLAFTHLYKVDEMTTAVAGFCQQLEDGARLFARIAKAGRPRTPFALEVFLTRMIGIAKTAGVYPSTPSRALRSQTAPREPPAFFNFVLEALSIAREVIHSSPLDRHRKDAALAVVRDRGEQSLSKHLERLRGNISKYKRGKHGGLVEW